MSLKTWIERQNATLQKTDVQPWGSYSLCVSFNNGPMAQLPRRFGYGWTEVEALEHSLREMMNDGKYHSQLRQWLGIDKFESLQYSVNQPEPSTALVKV